MVARTSRGTQQRAESPAQEQEEEAERDEEEQEEQQPGDKRAASPEKLLQHVFLQTMLSRRSMASDVGAEVYKRIVALCKVRQPLPYGQFIRSLDESLDTVGLAIKEQYDAENGLMVTYLVNTLNDGVAKLATEYLPQEIAFFRLIVSKIMNAPNLAYAISNKEALRCVSDDSVKPNITKVAGEVLIKSLIAKGWLNMSASRQLTLAGRALAELDEYLRNTFGDDEDDDVDVKQRVYVDCGLCMHLVTYGWACPNENCGKRLHHPCTVRGLKQGKCEGDKDTPCNQYWEPAEQGRFTGEPIGSIDRKGAQGQTPEAESEEDDSATQLSTKRKGRRAPNGGASKSRGKKATQDDEEEGGEDEEEEEAQESDADSAMEGLKRATQEATRRQSGRSRGSGRNYADEDDQASD